MRLLHPSAYNLHYRGMVAFAQQQAQSVRRGTVSNASGGVSSQGLCDFDRPQHHIASIGRTRTALILSTGERIAL